MEKQRQAKIIATIGPACSDEKVLKDLINAGMNVARLNFSHGDHQSHLEIIKKIRSVSGELGKPVAILQDLQGPKIRVGDIQEGGKHLIEYSFFTVSNIDRKDPNHIFINYPPIVQDLEVGSRIFFDDGMLELIIREKTDEHLVAQVLQGGILYSKKGVNLPGIDIKIPAFTEKDKRDLQFGLENCVDAVAVSFVRSAEDIKKVRYAIQEFSELDDSIPVFAKLERPEAIRYFDEILSLSDGVMVARGDLGIEIETERVPIIQKEIIEKVNKAGKLVITATQMLNSMITNSRPTRAETSDVANAIFDGSDAVMLSGETAIGKNPIKSVQVMDTIIRKAEDNLSEWGHWKGKQIKSYSNDVLAVTHAAHELANDLDVQAIVVFTQTGRTARLMSKTHPRVPIIGSTPVARTFTKMAFFRGVYPIILQPVQTIEEMLEQVQKEISRSAFIKSGQQIVVIAGYPVGEINLPNFAMLYTIK